MYTFISWRAGLFVLFVQSYSPTSRVLGCEKLNQNNNTGRK